MEQILPKDFWGTDTIGKVGIAGVSDPVLKIKKKFRRWTEAPIAHTFGNKPLVNVHGAGMFVELALVQYFLEQGWDARWVVTYGRSRMNPLFLTEWLDTDCCKQIHRPVASSYVCDVLQSVAKVNGNKMGGCWDVIAWKGDCLLFVEVKREKHDRIRSTQIRWLNSALECGLTCDQFMLLEWDFYPEPYIGG